MKIQHSYDIYGRTEPSIIYLAAPGKRILSAINGIDSSSVNLTLNTNNTAELTFSVNKYIDGNVLSNAYDSIEEMMELYCDGIWFKITDPPSISNDGMKEKKDVTAQSYEITLSQYSLNEFKANTGDKSSYEVIYKDTHREYLLNKIKETFVENYKKSNPNATESEIQAALSNYDADDELDNNTFFQVKFCYTQDQIDKDPTLADLSLLHLILKHSKADKLGWHIEYVDNVTPDNEDEEEKQYLPDYISNFNVTNKTVYSFLTQEVASTCRCLFEFDTENLGIYVYRPETLGHDTNIFLSFRNIQNNISISRDDSLITQFYVDGLDKYNIDAANLGKSLITDLSYFMKEPYMPKSLIEKYSAYLDNREKWRLQYKLYSKYQAILNDKLTELTNRVPVDTTGTDYFSLSMKDLQSAYTSNTAILAGLERTYVDNENNFNITELKKHKSDWNLYESIKNYTIPSITAAMQYKKDNGNDYEEGDFIPSGTGNILINPNPVVLGNDWQILGKINIADIKLTQIQDLYSTNENKYIYGITRGVKLPSKNYEVGISQCKVNVTKGNTYILSCYARLLKNNDDSSGLYLSYCKSGDSNGHGQLFDSVQESWTRFYYKFQSSADIIDVKFESIIANIEICGMQLELVDENTNTPSSFGYYIQSSDDLKAYETDWDLYGIDELKVKIKTYENSVTTLKGKGFNKPYNELSGNNEDYANRMYRNYLDYESLLSQAQKALKERQAEYDLINNPKDGGLVEIDKTDDDGNIILDENNNPCKISIPGLSILSKEKTNMIKNTDIDNWGKTSINTDGISVGVKFTDKELKIIQLLCRQASYSNDNIVVTSLTTPESSIKQQELLYQDALKELYIESHPQYTYTDDIENIYALPEFRVYHDQLNVNDYIHLCIDDSSQKYIKLRLIQITYNPCDLDETMTITFSNMVQYKSKTNDYDKLFNSVLSTSSYDGGSVQGVSKNSDTSSYVISSSVIQQMFSNPLFLSKMSGTTGASSTISIDSIISQLLAADQEKYNNLTDQTGFIKQLNSQCLTSDWVVEKLKNSVNQYIDLLFNKNISVEDRNSGVTIQNSSILKSQIIDSPSITTNTLTSTGETNIENLNNISSISNSAATSIKNCHTHDEINTLQEQINSLQKEIDALKQPAS